MSALKLHLIAPAGTLGNFMQSLGVDSASAMKRYVQEIVGDRLQATGNDRLLDAVEDEDHGGRKDDAQRAEDINQALADEDVRLILALRGGAWLTRILPRIDLSLLARRKTKVALFGFSELTLLVNLLAAHQNGIGVYDMSPAFLTYGLKRFALLSARSSQSPYILEDTSRISSDSATAPPRFEDLFPDDWMRAHLHTEFAAHLRDVVSMTEGRGTSRPISARLVRGQLADSIRASFIGGNLCLFTAFLGTPYEKFVQPDNRWIVLEEINEKPERIDRFLARLTLAGWLDRCAGLLLGDFHNADKTHTAATIELLDFHLNRRDLPLLVCDTIGHIWPMSPLPILTPTTISLNPNGQYSITWDPVAIRTTN